MKKTNLIRRIRLASLKEQKSRRREICKEHLASMQRKG